MAESRTLHLYKGDSHYYGDYQDRAMGKTHHHVYIVFSSFFSLKTYYFNEWVLMGGLCGSNGKESYRNSMTLESLTNFVAVRSSPAPLWLKVGRSAGS